MIAWGLKFFLKAIELILRLFGQKMNEPFFNPVDLSQLEPKGLSSGKVFIVIPFRDRWELTSKCLDTLHRLEIPENLKVVVILADNGSIEAKTAEGIKHFMGKANPFEVKHLILDYPFNYSKINNDAIKLMDCSSEDILWFLNNDIQVISMNCLTIFRKALSYKEIGILGNTLLYPNGSIQHLYAMPGVKMIAAHPFRGKDLNLAHPWFKSWHIVPAVTGASLVIRFQDFQTIGGFDENLPTLGQDIDLCLRSQKIGLLTITCPEIQMIHEESVSKKSNFPFEEVGYMYRKWDKDLTQHKLVPKKYLRWSEQPYMVLYQPPYPAKLVAKFSN